MRRIETPMNRTNKTPDMRKALVISSVSIFIGGG